MIVFKTVDKLQKHLALCRQAGSSIGFVPTMGALHQGHISLIEASLDQCHTTVCSIFVNPTQFNDPRDFDKYPITIEKDIELLIHHHTDVLFLPSVGEIYPQGMQAQPYYALGPVETVLEGRHRPNHFQGVCQVVHRLLQIVQPHKVFFGQKDYQQCMVIEKLLQLTGCPVEMHIQPTVREAGGLAMSSRNMRLSNDARLQATALYKALSYIKDHARTASIPLLTSRAVQILEEAGFEKTDYISIADAHTLQPLRTWGDAVSAVALAAAFIEGVRLIDNVTLDA